MWAWLPISLKLETVGGTTSIIFYSFNWDYLSSKTMSTTGYNTRNRVACVRCKQRHKPPVGTSCTRIKPVSRKVNTNGLQGNEKVINLGAVDASARLPHPGHSNTSHTQATVDTPAQKSTKRKHPTNSEVMKKLDTVLEQFCAMEKRFQQQERRDGAFSALSAPSAHSSPKRSAHGSSTSRRTSHSHTNPPSLEFLRNDSDIQAQVDKRLRHYDQVNREEATGTSTNLKSGRYRLGDQRVKRHVLWPHEFCAVGENLKMPSYEEINIYQWVQGFARCVLEEKDPAIRSHMLAYQGNLMQDALELSWPTAKRAHAAVLTEIERGQASWEDHSTIDRIRQRFTQRVLKGTQSVSTDEQTRICKRYNEETCGQAKDHSDGKVIYKHSCFSCFKAVKRHYSHPEAKCNRAKRLANTPTDKAQV